MLVFLLTSVNAVATSMTLATLESALDAKLASKEVKDHRYPSPTHEANKLPKMELSEAISKVKSLPSAVTDAMKITTLHHHKKHHHHSDNAQLIQQQEEMKKKGIEEALDKAKETLSNMMEETETELDEAILTCKEYDAATTATLDENAGFRAMLGGQVAEAKAMIAEAKMMINEATTELDTLKTISEEHARQCEITITTQQEGLAILEADLAVSMKVENMTDCDDVSPGSTTTLMQCGTGYARRFKFAGQAASHYEGFTQLKSKEGQFAVQRAAKMIMKVDDDSYGNAKYVPSKTITRKGLIRNHRNIPIKTKNGLVQRSKKIGVYEGSTPSP